MSDPGLDAPSDHEPNEADIAIVGMAGRFPGAPDADALWTRVVAGDDCLVDLDPDMLIAAGVPAAVVNDEHYVPRTGLLPNVDRFDPEFFGIGPRDAALMDPQHRIFLECVWEAIESAAHVPERFDGAIGVFAGCGMNTYLINNLITNPKLLEQVGWFLLRHTSNDKDFLPTFASYKLDLHGPSISVQTACSTSLVAMHLAAQSLLSFECDMAIAGGSTIEVPHGVGYTFQEGEILSPDGRCRSFDEDSNGTVLTSGAGAVALRRYTDALEDGDPILAVMKASAVNNDGARKVSYLAPSVDGHADVVKEALVVAGLDARDIELVDAHGTGTPVGDPIEFAALTEAFRDSTDETGFCRLTSTKPNIGHLDTAAGVASVIKVVQALRHATLPPLANFSGPSPLLDVASSPFELAGKATPWTTDRPRRAGVSSLGVGGTNAHVLLEEAMPVEASTPGVNEQLITLSGRSTAAIDDIGANLATYLEEHPDTELADVAHTMLVGRRSMPYRRVVAAEDTASAPAVLRGENRRRRMDGHADERAPRLAFMFPGGGSQYPGMGVGLDDRFDVYHEVLADGIKRVITAGGPDLSLLTSADADADELRRADVSLPAVFLTSVALARQWMAWGAIPDALVGHSLGEYVAAHLAGVLTLDDAIALVVVRSRLMAEASGGKPVGMLAVSLPADECAELLPDDIDLSVVNTDGECVISGPSASIDAVAATLRERDVDVSLLDLEAAAHSSVLDPILDEFAEFVSTVSLSAPTIPYLSNLTGDWITEAQATNPQYWVDHLRGTVRFDRCLKTALADGPLVLAELGPGQTLSSYARRQDPKPVAAFGGLRHPKDETPDTAYALQAFGGLWAHGIDVDLDRFNGGQRRRLRLPTYAFQRERFWIDPGEGVSGGSGVKGVVEAVSAPPVERIADVTDWFWEPTWTPTANTSSVLSPETTSWTIVADDGDLLGEQVRDELIARGFDCSITPGPVDAASLETTAVCLVGQARPERDDLDSASQLWLDSGLDIIRHLTDTHLSGAVFGAISRGSTTASGPARRPVDALAHGPVLVAPKEYPGLRTTLVDIDDDETADISTIVDELLAPQNAVRAIRGRETLEADFQPKPTEQPADDDTGFVHGGAYLVTGGLGEIGSEFAAHLAERYGARVALLSSAEMPPESEWETWELAHGSGDAMSRRLRRLRELRSLGGDVVVVRGDTSDPASLRNALDQVEEHFGSIDGVIHAAGRLDDALIALMPPGAHRGVVGPKAVGAAVLVDELAQRDAGLLILMSSTSSFLGSAGQVSYVATNAYLDALAGADTGSLRVITFNSGAWRGIGMAAVAARRLRLGIADGVAIAHPVLNERVTDASGNVELIGQLVASDDWVVNEHRTSDGIAILPGTGHLDLALTALGHSALADHVVRDLLMIEPLVVPDGADVVVKVTVSSDDSGGSITIWSDRGEGLQWSLHSQAVISGVTLDDDRPAVQPDGVLGDGAREIDAMSARRAGLQLGAHWDSVASASALDGEAVAELSLPEGLRNDVDAWTAHPGLVDVAIGVAIDLRETAGETLMAPVAIESVVSHRPLPASVSVHAVRRPSDGGDLVVDITVKASTDLATAEPALVVRGLTLRDLGSGSALSTPAQKTTRAGRNTAGGIFVELAEGAGIGAEDAGTILDRLAASDADRLVVSSVDLAALAPAEVASDGDEATQTDLGEVSGLENVLAAMWSDLLGVDVGQDDDFFDLGGHSLIAIRLIARIQRELGVKLDLAVLFDAPTVALLSPLIRAQRPDIDDELGGSPTSTGVSADQPPPVADDADRPEPRTFVPLSTSGSGTPLTVVHGAGGSVFFLSQLARRMRSVRPLNGMQAAGILASDQPDPSIEAMAERYVRDLTAQTDGPHLLGGFSGGGIIALEMTRLLQELGHEVRAVVLFDSVPAGAIELPAWTSRRNVARNVVRHGLGPSSSYLKHRLRRRAARMLDLPTSIPNVALSMDDEFGDDGVVDLSDHFSEISLDYELKKYDVDVVLVRADLMWLYQPDDYHWTGHVGGTLTKLTAPGTHESMFQEPNAEVLWERLAPVLDELDN